MIFHHKSESGIEPDENRTRNLLFWSQTLFHCATDPQLFYGNLPLFNTTNETTPPPRPSLAASSLERALVRFSSTSYPPNGVNLDSPISLSLFPGNHPILLFLFSFPGNLYTRTYMVLINSTFLWVSNFKASGVFYCCKA